jgi:hypothetical protein
MTTETPGQDQEADAGAAPRRGYQLAGFVTGLILGLLVVVPLAYLIL